MKGLKITILNDNEPSPGLKNDWGWSVLLETEKWKILFDADGNPEVIEYNSKKLGIDLREIDFAFLSHFHYDHYGGFEYFGRIKKLRVYVPEENKILEKFGLESVTVKKLMELIENVYSTGPISGFFIKEQAMVIKCENFNVLVVGCSHPGIDNIAFHAQEIAGDIYLTIGGFHSPSFQKLDNLSKISKYISPAHCSGNNAKDYIKSKYREKFIYVRTGSIVYLPFE